MFSDNCACFVILVCPKTGDPVFQILLFCSTVDIQKFGKIQNVCVRACVCRRESLSLTVLNSKLARAAIFLFVQLQNKLENHNCLFCLEAHQVIRLQYAHKTV